MKKKNFTLRLPLLFSCLSAALLSSSAFSLAGDGIKVISTKITCKKGPCDAAAVDPRAIKGLDHGVSVRVADAQWPVNYPGKAVSNHGVYILNKANKTQTVNYTFEVKVGDDYMQLWRQVEVRPEGHGVDSMVLTLGVTKEQVGKYEIEASTRLEGDLQAVDKKYATFTVTERGN